MQISLHQNSTWRRVWSLNLSDRRTKVIPFRNSTSFVLYASKFLFLIILSLNCSSKGRSMLVLQYYSSFRNSWIVMIHSKEQYAIWGVYCMWQWTSMLNLHIAILGHISTPSRCLNPQNMDKRIRLYKIWIYHSV